MSEGDTVRLTDGGGLNTDDRLPLEFSAPRALYVDTWKPNWSPMRSFKRAALPDITGESLGDLDRPEVRHQLGMASLRRSNLEDAWPHLRRALELDPGYTPALLPAAAVSLALNRPAEAPAFARQVIAREPANPRALLVSTRSRPGRHRSASSNSLDPPFLLGERASRDSHDPSWEP